jgi:hypothetical protein
VCLEINILRNTVQTLFHPVYGGYAWVDGFKRLLDRTADRRVPLPSARRVWLGTLIILPYKHPVKGQFSAAFDDQCCGDRRNKDVILKPFLKL